jgi:transcriptional regulator with XRE-family HTH domain
MVVTLKSYLARLEEGETARPEGQRRAVPQLDELAGEIGVHRVTLSNIVNNKGELLNLRIAARIIGGLRARGFDTDVGDILAYEERYAD